MNDEIEDIKARLDIVDIIGSYLTLKRAGANMKANCPFHNEKTPSMMISSERQTFKCFGCGEGGDIFTFIEKMEGVDFYNALKILADKAGVQLKTKSVRYGEREYKADKKTRILEINEWAKKLYHKLLVDHPKASKAREYLKTRKMEDKTIEEFEIGYAPDSWELLVKFLKQKGYTEEEMAVSGVVIKSEKGKYYDRFRGRIMFPINNIMGNTVAFTSRILKTDPDQAKYINSSESPIYIKGKTIYGLDKAKLAIKEADMAIFVEGNMDVIACHQAGFRNVVATSGTAITEEQLKILNRYGGEIAFSFDSDTAGVAAMKKAIILALKNDINAKIISLTGPYKDADEAIGVDPKNWERAVKNAKSGLARWIDLLILDHPDLDVSTKKNIAREILPVIKIIFSPIEKEYYIKYLATKLAISEQALVSALSKTKDMTGESRSFAGVQDDKKEIGEVKLSVSEKIAGLLWLFPEMVADFKGDLETRQLNIEKWASYINMLKLGLIEKNKLPKDLVSEIDQVALLASREMDLADKDSIRLELKYLFARVKSDEKEQIKASFAQKIQAAEGEGDKEKVKKLLAEFSSLIK